MRIYFLIKMKYNSMNANIKFWFIC
jgi:hypothetical protein